jgi:predicted transcriptional regulator
MKLATVNVVEVNNDGIMQVLSFDDSEEGNKEAEDIFRKLVIENGAVEANISDLIENGAYGDPFGYQVFIVHSS